MSISGLPWLRALAAPLLVAAVLANPTSAEARVHVGPDPRGDVVKFGQLSETVATVPGRAIGDITSTVFRHTNTRVRIRYNLADLRPQLEYAFFDLELTTNEGLIRWLDLTIAPGQRAGVVTMHRVNGTELTPVPCSAHREVDYVENVVIIGIPRRCVSNPRWVRIGGDVRTQDPNNPASSDPPLFVDKAFQGPVPDAEPGWVPSPRIYRGNRGP